MNGGFTTPQSAVIGYRMVGSETKILLVTSRTRGRWVLPKGMITPGMTPAQSALKEAWEEAGAVGIISGRCLGVYRYMKTRRYGVRSCAVQVYAMKVTGVLPKWPEQRLRKRRWMSVDEAICQVMNRDLKRLLVRFRARSGSRSLVFHRGSDREGDRCVARIGSAGAAARAPSRWQAGEAPDPALLRLSRQTELAPRRPRNRTGIPIRLASEGSGRWLW